jgi:hypothetical protein
MTTFTATAPIVKANDGRYGLRAPKGGATVGGKVYRGGSFCLPYQIDNHHELPAVEIKGPSGSASYLVQAIEAGECGVAAVRLVKLSSGEAYDVLRTHDGLVECSCPDYEFKRRGTDQPCKHGRAAIVNGLLIPPAPVAEIEPTIETDAADTWDAWTDSDVWELGPAAPDFDPDGDRWTTETPCVEPAALAGDNESRGPLEGPRPTARHGYAPSVEDDAYASGFALQADRGIAAEAPTAWGVMRSSAFRLGQVDGLLARLRREREAERAEDARVDREYAERMEDAFGGPGSGWHEAERIEAIGSIEARRMTP